MGKLSSILVVGAVLGIVIWLRPAHDPPSVSARQQIRHDVLAAERQADARVPGDAAVSKDVRTTAAIEAQLSRDPSLSGLEIDVTTTDGRVTLAGRVDSAGELLRAIEIAFADSNVRQVVSTLQISRRQAHADQPVLPR